MREHPILFSAAMIRALLDDKKSQTRRVVKLGMWPHDAVARVAGPYLGIGFNFKFAEPIPDDGGQTVGIVRRCPFGEPGDRLWVRETWGVRPGDEVVEGTKLLYRACEADDYQWSRAPLMRWRPSIHMPRWASRITLEITGVRVERLQDISGSDALAEGVRGAGRDPDRQTWEGDRLRAVRENEASARVVYRNLWDALNAKRGAGWDLNPWVWALDFKRVTGT